VGGETAIHPGDLEPGHYDLAGFCVAVVERDQVITGQKTRAGDVVLGLSSTGLHSNGYSLARKVLFDHAKLDIDRHISELGTTVGNALLEPTRIYVKPVLQAIQNYPDAIHGLAHITGGGLVDNAPRILPQNCQVTLKRGSWPLPPVFPWLQRLGNIEQNEMDRVFNGGIGFVVIAASEKADALQRHFQQAQIPAFLIGEVRPGSPEVVFA